MPTIVVNAEPYEFEFELDRTALLIIDMQRDFVDPGGFGEAVMRLLHEMGLSDVELSMHALPDRFIEHGSQSDLLREAGLTVSILADAAKKLARK